MYKKKRVTAVILAAGNGSRMGSHDNKVYLRLGGHPVIQYSLLAFDGHPNIDELVLVIRPEEQGDLEEILGTLPLQKPWRIAFGGDTRQESVRKAIAEVKNPLVMVHDGARPFVQKRYIDQCLEILERMDGVIVALPGVRGLMSLAGRPVDQMTYAAQTPQCFHTKILRKCHEKHVKTPGITDDSSLLEREGYQVGIVAGDLFHIKITTPLDLPLAEAYLAEGVCVE